MPHPRHCAFFIGNKKLDKRMAAAGAAREEAGDA